MNIDIVREFQVFAVSQNLSKAARELHVTQSCLSKHMAELEAETGLDLIDHGSKKVTLTSVGKYFASEMAVLLFQWDDCLRRCMELQKEAHCELRIAVFLEGNDANDVLYRAGNGFRKACPNVDIVYAKLVGSSPAEAIRDSLFDVVVDVRCGEPSSYRPDGDYLDMRAVPISRNPLLVWMSKHNSLSEEGGISLDDLLNIPIMTSMTNVYDYMRDMTRDAFSRYGAEPLFKPVHFDAESPASFFLSDFDDRSVMLTTLGMADNRCLSGRKDIVHLQTTDPRLEATSLVMCLTSNKCAMSFLDYIEQLLSK